MLVPPATELGRPLKLRERVARGLRASITSGELETGRVYSVPTLAAEFGMSSTPVREAVLGLARERLVEVVPNKGFRVLEVSLDELAQINEVRLLLEPAAIANLAGQLSPSQCDGLRAHIDVILEHAQMGDRQAAAEAAFVFRDVLLHMCPNVQLVETIVALRARARAGFPKTSIDYARFAATQYSLVEALASGDKDKVVRTISYEVSRLGPTLRRVPSKV
jgi:DNA-binding GntR family transcriptional regulator